MPSSEVMPKWKAGQLHSGSKTGPIVKNQKQAVAIMLSEKRNEAEHGGRYKSKADKYERGGEVASKVMGPVTMPPSPPVPTRSDPRGYAKGGSVDSRIRRPSGGKHT